MKNKINCFIANLGGCVYLIPNDQRDIFDGTNYYDRKRKFNKYMIYDDIIIEDLLISDNDMERLINGDYM